MGAVSELFLPTAHFPLPALRVSSATGFPQRGEFLEEKPALPPPFLWQSWPSELGAGDFTENGDLRVFVVDRWID